jgi:hypothetical protein
MKRYVLVPILAAAAMAIYSAPANAQATRTWVSGVGDDVNPCSRTAPCKTFAGAISKTAAGGEINCLDPGGFGAVTITKNMTIDCEGTVGSILAAGTNGVNVNGANIVVNLRNISIHGAGTGLVGVNFITGAQLNLHNVSIFGFKAGSALGVRFSPNTGNSALLITNSSIFNNGIVPATGGGIAVQPAVGGTAFATIKNSNVDFNTNAVAFNSASGNITATVRDSTLASNRAGVVAAGANVNNVMVERTAITNTITGAGIQSGSATSTVRVGNSVITGNTSGVTTSGGGVVLSYGNNMIDGNGTDGTPIPGVGLD